MPPERLRPASLIATVPARLRELGRFWTRREALPAVLLLLALATVFLFGNDRGHFYRGGHHDWLTSQHLTQAVNLSPQHQFLLFVSHTLDVEGDAAYLTYARWPIGSYALVKVATLPFGDNFAAGIYAARIVMLLLFAGAAALAYLALARLCGNGWVALTATLLAFSSYYCLYYNDAFAPDAVPGLFGALLAFHGMVIFEQEGRFRQLLIKSCAGLLLCWPAYALLLPYIVFALARDAFRARAGASAPPPPRVWQGKSGVAPPPCCPAVICNWARLRCISASQYWVSMWSMSISPSTGRSRWRNCLRWSGRRFITAERVSKVLS